jgi:hypothetical protein
MKILFVQPPIHNKMGLQLISLPEPLGLETIAGSLIGKHDVEIFDTRLERNIRKKLNSCKPDAVGVSASFTADVYSTFRIPDGVNNPPAS